jgi:hypothetical protein
MAAALEMEVDVDWMAVEPVLTPLALEDTRNAAHRAANCVNCPLGRDHWRQMHESKSREAELNKVKMYISM